MPKIKLDEERANGWGYYSYMLGAYKNKSVQRLKFRHTFVSSSGNKTKTIKRAIHENAFSYWTNIVYFTVPLKTTVFGDLRNKGFIGFTANKELHLFDKPLLWSEALEEIENWRKK